MRLQYLYESAGPLATDLFTEVRPALRPPFVALCYQHCTIYAFLFVSSLRVLTKLYH